MIRTQLYEELSRYITSGISFLNIISDEESEIEQSIRAVCSSLQKELIVYDSLQGFSVPDDETVNQDFGQTIYKWTEEPPFKNRIILVKDVSSVLQKASNLRAIRMMAQTNHTKGIFLPYMLICLANENFLPHDIKTLSVTWFPALMNKEERKEYINELLNERALTVTEDILNAVSELCNGLTQDQIKKCINLCLIDKVSDKHNFIRNILIQKTDIFNQEGLLEIEKSCRPEEIGGYKGLKQWISKSKDVLTSELETGIIQPDGLLTPQSVFPKGILMVGVTGCGKSLCAKVTAGIMELPLVRIDFGRIMDKYVGSSEKNLLRALRIVEELSPCVLWLDEFEKSLSNSGSGNDDVAKRLLGSFLLWMQERNKAIFIVATVNNISVLPTELLRRGRFDRIYYVDLPDDNARREIFNIHARKLGLNFTRKRWLDEYVSKTHDYSGADIEYILKEAKRTIISEKIDISEEELIHKIIVKTITSTKSVQMTMGVEVKKMKAEFTQREFDNVNE